MNDGQVGPTGPSRTLISLRRSTSRSGRTPGKQWSRAAMVEGSGGDHLEVIFTIA